MEVWKYGFRAATTQEYSESKAYSALFSGGPQCDLRWLDVNDQLRVSPWYFSLHNTFG